MKLYNKNTRWNDMTQNSSPPDDTFQIRCSKLGHQIHFSYCRRENFGLPCARIITCWHPYFSVEKFLRHELSEGEWKDTFETKPKAKAVTLIELIEQAQKIKKEESK
jgi:hypothetical protein